MIWAQHDKELYFFAKNVSTHQALAMSKKMPDRVIVRINQDGQELTKYLNGERIVDRKAHRKTN